MKAFLFEAFSFLKLSYSMGALYHQFLVRSLLLSQCTACCIKWCHRADFLSRLSYRRLWIVKAHRSTSFSQWLYSPAVRYVGSWEWQVEESLGDALRLLVYSLPAASGVIFWARASTGTSYLCLWGPYQCFSGPTLTRSSEQGSQSPHYSSFLSAFWASWYWSYLMTW